MKTKKLLTIVLFAGLVATSVGVFSHSIINSENVKEVNAAETVKTISAIYGKNRPGGGEGGRSPISISAKEIVGTYGASYVGTVFSETGDEMTLTLIPNGGVSGGWAGEGTRRFDLRVDYGSFYEYGVTKFYITKDTKFVGSDCSIVFGTEYKFSSIYDGGCKFEVFTPTVASFNIGLFHQRMSAVLYRVGVNNMSGISAGFKNHFKADINGVNFDVYDAGAGSVSGNRLVYIETNSELPGHKVSIPDGTLFKCDGNIESQLVMEKGYYMEADGDAANKLIAVKTSNDYATFASSSIVCDSSGSNEPAYTDNRSWTLLSNVFNVLNEETKNQLKYGLSSEDTTIKSFVEKYIYIIKKYGISKYPNFIGVQDIFTSDSMMYGIINGDTNNTIVVLIITMASISTIGLFYAKKKRHH